MTINIGIATSPFRESFQYAFDQEISIVKENISLEEMIAYDLIIFSGGADIHPSIYGESITYSRGIIRKRDEIEIDILSKAMLLGIKVFGVCRGHQLINAHLGGSLIQDLFMGQKPGLTHSSPHSLEKITSDRFLDGICVVNSLHHQGVIATGKGLQGTSVHKKIIESTMGSNIYSVQFHPEFMLELDEIRKFFKYFKNYVKNNEKKKDPKTVSISDLERRPSTKERRLSSLMSTMSRLESHIRASLNVGQFIAFTRDFSDLSETNLELRIIPEHEAFLVNLYETKDRINSTVGELNNRDEELYMMMDEDNFESDEEFEEIENEREEIAIRVDTYLQEVAGVNTTLVESARDIVEMINQGGWNREGMEIPNRRDEDSERNRGQRVSFSEEESVTSPAIRAMDVSVNSSTTITSSDIDWSFTSDSDS
jgi:putative glutamine amidotransferase